MLFGVALLFALHPIQAEAVNYINARSNLLATTFYLLGVLCFLRWRAALADRIAVTVQTRYMPIGNLTGMTDAERATVASWYAQVKQ